MIEPISKIVIAGGGTAGWMTAAALSNTLQNTCEIVLIESDEIGTVGVGEATIPQMSVFNHSLGIDEDDMLACTQGTIKLGIEFVDWSHLGSRYMHPFGLTGVKTGMVPFYHYWLKQREVLASQGKEIPHIDEYCLNTCAARKGKFTRPTMQDKSPLRDVSYAFHFDAGLYAKYLRDYSEKRGVIRQEGKIVKTNLRPEDGFIESVALEKGEIIKGELFIDCTGFRALLIEEALKTGYEDYSHYLPCDRAWAVACENPEAPAPYTRSTARTAGWQWRIPLQHRMGNGHVFSSQFMSDDEAVNILLTNLEAKALADPRLIRFKTGRRKKFWNKNCVAIGLSSGFLEPLESTSIHLIQMGIAKLIYLFPDKQFREIDSKQYNEKSILEFERIRDFIILHYHATQRSDSEFWNYCRNMAIPEYLSKKISLFESSGRIFRKDEELFSEAGWFAVMNGQGIKPKTWHPFVDNMPKDKLTSLLGNTRNNINRIANGLPSQQEFIARHFPANL